MKLAIAGLSALAALCVPGVASAACQRLPRAQAIAQIDAAWADERLTAAESRSLNELRFCQFDRDGNGSITEGEFANVVVGDFNRADRNRDGVLSTQREIAIFSDSGAPAIAGLTREQARYLGRVRFAILDQAPRDSMLTEREFVSVTEAEFRRADANRDGVTTRQEAARQTPGR